MKALFTEKEKELVMAVAKVEQLTQQLEDIRKERTVQKNGEKSAAAIELEKLKQELMVSVCLIFLISLSSSNLLYHIFFGFSIILI